MDGGCEYYGYASDITRTWPVNGKFNEAQRELYELVLHVQDTCLKVTKCVFYEHVSQLGYEEIMNLLNNSL